MQDLESYKVLKYQDNEWSIPLSQNDECCMGRAVDWYEDNLWWRHGQLTCLFLISN